VAQRAVSHAGFGGFVAGLVRILDRDLRAAAIPKRDERGRSVDVHALRHTFGTLLSRAGVAPRTAQAAMRHSSIDLTMNVYTDPKLLDVHGAIESLPTLNLDAERESTQATLRATGTNDLRRFCVAPTVAPTLYKSCPNESFPVKTTGRGSQRNRNRDDDEHPLKSSEKASFAGVANEALKIGLARTGLNRWRRWPRRAFASTRSIGRRNCDSWLGL
jgi:hypothetical protein